MLNQFTAEASQRLALPGRVVSAMDNLLTQVHASGELTFLADMGSVIPTSSEVGRFEPKQPAAWQEGVERFGELRCRVS